MKISTDVNDCLVTPCHIFCLVVCLKDTFPLDEALCLSTFDAY